MSPVLAAHDWQSVAFKEQQRLWQRMVSVPAVVRQAFETRVGTSPCDVVLQQGTHKLLRYRRDTPATHVEPVLICYALINRPYILDLQPDKSIVRRYLEEGFEVYMIDWGVPAKTDRGLGLEHYVFGFIQAAVDRILGSHQRDQLHLVGYCMGGTMAAMFAALEPQASASLTLLATPIDFEPRESLLNIWADPCQFDVDAFIEVHGNCPAWFLQACFVAMKPVQSFVEKNLALYERMDDGAFVANHFAMELWINDNIPVAGETFRQFVRDLYQRNKLVHGAFALGDRAVDLGRIRCPVLLLTAKNDHLVAPSSTEGIRRCLPGSEVTSMMADAGHVGLVVGAKTHRTLWPQATRWMSERSTEFSASKRSTGETTDRR